MLNSEITKSERLDIAFAAGRLAAVNGRLHKLSGFEYDNALRDAFMKGAEAQCRAVRAAAGKVPLVFKDERP